MARIPILVSRCLLGVPCRYHGRTPRGGTPGRPHCRIIQLLATGKYRPIDICPEVDAGLPTPRPPARPDHHGRLLAARVDVTAAFDHGADLAVAAAEGSGARKAYLLRGSPACDKNVGRAALALQRAGVRIISI